MKGSYADWRSDLEASRDLTDQEKQNPVFLLAWYEHWRLGQGLEPVRASAVRFWNEQVITKPRKDWQLERWAEAMRWHRRWLELCAENGREPRSLGERLHRAVMLAGARRGLALRTRQTYAGWMARYGEWVAGAEEAMDTERGSAWLAELVDKGKVSFATQKQALNALAFFFKDVCRKEEVLFDVRLRRTAKRTPVVMSAKEVVALLDKLEPRYRLMAEMQYGAGLRLRELVSLRVQDVDRARGQVVVRGGKGKSVKMFIRTLQADFSGQRLGDQAREQAVESSAKLGNKGLPRAGGLLSARDHSPLWFTSRPFCRGAANFPHRSRIPSKNTKAVILPALKRLRLPNRADPWLDRRDTAAGMKSAQDAGFVTPMRRTSR
jgi:integrase